MESNEQANGPSTTAGEFFPVAPMESIVPGTGQAFEIHGRMVAVFNDNGQFHAIDDFCPHMGASLSAGYLEDGVVTCPWHAWRFRVCDGTWCDNPKLKISSFPLRIVAGVIEVCVPPKG